jgi:hypothetical protein
MEDMKTRGKAEGTNEERKERVKWEQEETLQVGMESRRDRNKCRKIQRKRNKN